MGRPWEYPRWRRMLMQAVMWVILAGTVGLAQLVVIERRRAPIALEAARVRVGPLWVRTPVDWSTVPGSNPDAGDLELVDENDPSRRLAIGVERNPVGRDSGGQLNQPGAGTQPIDFKGLKQTGVLVASRHKIRPRGGNWTQVDILLAFTQLPSGYVVEIQLMQMGARLGTADAELVKAVANAITWAGQPQQRRVPVRSPDQTEVD